ncbi:eIF3 subunit 6 N terminal domain-containing protein [Helicosporidium sp. ATCC 50920]|nr:eIF3 subunit 6 N terminal domain-containing protein [Helicosporidium sp. ATCC 50920]|eukprot:KDD74800.1 eIF3 subunit 6 N terminal domain-containing protein [Helicosporidium sp. ATCC 50920]
MGEENMASPSGAAVDPTQYDLTFVMAKSLDRHLVFPLLEFLSQKELYSHREIETAKLELISRTHMVDYAVDIWQSVNQTEEVPASLVTRRAEVVSRLKTLEAQVKPITDFLSAENNVKLLKQDKTQNQAFLAREFGIGPEQIDALYHFAKWNFECGNYTAAAEYLYHYRMLSTNAERGASALWGKLAAGVLLQDFESAMEDLLKLKELIDLDTFAPVGRQLASRAWLLHWSLFVFFNHENGLNALLDLFMQERYLTALQMVAPHLLRYVTVAAVVNRRRRATLKDLVRVIAQEQYQYKDPVTEFLRSLMAEADFEGAQAALVAAEPLLAADFFLAAAAPAFFESARTLLFESYCRVHRAVRLDTIGSRLGMDGEATEKWIVDLVRAARLHAKIDSKEGTVVMQAAPQGAREQLLERARGLSLRTFNLANTLVGVLRS